MSKFVFMGYGCKLFDVVIAYFEAVFHFNKKKNHRNPIFVSSH